MEATVQGLKFSDIFKVVQTFLCFVGSLPHSIKMFSEEKHSVSRICMTRQQCVFLSTPKIRTFGV